MSTDYDYLFSYSLPHGNPNPIMSGRTRVLTVDFDVEVYSSTSSRSSSIRSRAAVYLPSDCNSPQ